MAALDGRAALEVVGAVLDVVLGLEPKVKRDVVVVVVAVEGVPKENEVPDDAAAVVVVGRGLIGSGDVGMGDFARAAKSPEEEEVMGGFASGDLAKASSNPEDDEDDDLDGRSMVVAEEMDFVRSGATG